MQIVVDGAQDVLVGNARRAGEVADRVRLLTVERIALRPVVRREVGGSVRAPVVLVRRDGGREVSSLGSGGGPERSRSRRGRRADDDDRRASDRDGKAADLGEQVHGQAVYGAMGGTAKPKSRPRRRRDRRGRRGRGRTTRLSDDARGDQHHASSSLQK
jgi:hypothetical protein